MTFGAGEALWAVEVVRSDLVNDVVVSTSAAQRIFVEKGVPSVLVSRAWLDGQKRDFRLTFTY